MELYEQSVIGGFAENILLNGNHLLIIPVHEIHHHAFHAPFVEFCEYLIDVLVQCRPVQPNVDVNAARPGIFAYRLEVQKRNRSGKVRVRPGEAESGAVIIVPRHVGVAIDGMIFKTVVSREIYVVLVCQEVVAGLECRVGDFRVVPPWKCRFPGLKPRGVLYPARLAQACQHGAFHQSFDSVADHEHPPRGCAD